MALNLFTSKVDALKIIDGISNVLIGDKDNADITAAVVGNGNFLFDPKTGKVWSSDGSVFTDTTESLTAGTTDNAILKWDAGTSAWVEETDFTVTDAGLATAAAGFTASGGNIVASAGAVSANTTITAGTGVIATTGGLTATAGGLTVTAGTTDINDVTNISGAVTLDNAAANSLTMVGTTNTVSLNGSGATSLTLGGTTSTITLSGSGTKKVTGLDTPVAATDAVNKAYADSLSAGLDPKESTLTATTAVLSGTFIADNGTPATGEKTYNTTSKTITWFATEGPTAIDGVTLANGNTILVKDETATSGPSAGEGRQYNGIYTRTSLDVWTRRSDMDGSPANEISTGNFTFITSGSVNVGKGFVLSATNASNPDEINANTETKVFTQFSSAGGGVTSVSTESGSATPSGGSLTITGSPSINTSGSGSTVSVALAADLDTGATGFTVANYRVPFATATDTLGDSANITFDNTYKVIGVGDAASAPTNSALIFNSSAGSGISTFGVAEPIAGVFLATNTNSPALGVTTGQTSGSGITGDLTVKSGASISTGSSGAAVFGSGNGGSGGSGAVTLASGTTSGTRGSVTLAGNVINLNGLVTNAVVLTSAATDQETGSTTDAVATIALIREKVVLRKTGTTSVALAANAGAAKYLVYVVGNTAAERYASEVMVTSTNATTGVDSVEYSIVSGTTPAALSIVASAASGMVTLTVTQTAGTIVVEAIPLV